ncbi:DUF202 domain-containing protein [Kitasatospora sp. MBT63]|uniref:DUF202 domain-containing protein n=1 Tax=Kitasatospora sp. MBT63 TaxID=1444768 RepID=UPI0006913836|nr:DUF202 domain-containing protein [Kitasatospora sp. MBT63]
MTAAPEGRDPGLQPERTLLAWGRTALVLTVDALLVLRAGLVADRAALTATGGLLAAAACGFLGYGLRRRRRLERPGALPRAVPALPLRILTATVVVAAAGSAGCVLAGR